MAHSQKLPSTNLSIVIYTLCFGDPCHLSLLKTVNFDFHTQIAYIAIHCKRCNSIHSLQQCINEVLDYECHTLGYYAYYKKSWSHIAPNLQNILKVMYTLVTPLPHYLGLGICCIRVHGMDRLCYHPPHHQVSSSPRQK